jgi:hypothetical protein
MMILITEGVLMGGAGVQIVETRIFLEKYCDESIFT